MSPYWSKSDEPRKAYIAMAGKDLRYEDMLPLLNEDTEAMPIIPESIPCTKCNLAFAGLLHLGVDKFEDAIGYRIFRIKAIYKCPSCTRSTQFRIGGRVVTNGSFQKKRSETSL